MSFSAFNASLPTAQTGAVSSSVGATDSSKPSLFASPTGTDASSKSAPSPFGVVPKTSGFSFGAMATASSLSGSTKGTGQPENPTTTKLQGSLFGSAPVLSGASQQPTLGHFNTAPVAATKKTTHLPQTSGSGPAEKKVETPARIAKPSSAFEAQLWKLIVEFDRSIQRTKATSTSILSLDQAFNNKFTSQLKRLQEDVANLSTDVNKLDESRDSVEKDVLFVIGSDGDVHEQLEYSREILASFKDEKLLKLLEDQPLDQRSIDARQSLLSKLRALERSCNQLDEHLDGTTNSITGLPLGANVSSAHLFRTLKHTYDTSKLQYNMVCHLAQQVEALNLKSQSTTNNDVRQLPAQPRASSKQDVMDMLVESESRTANVRRHFLDLCKNVVTPRDVFATRRKLSQSPEATSPRTKAFSRLMPKSQLTVASPVSVTKAPPRISKPPQLTVPQEPSVSSKLFALAEQKASNQAPTLIQPPPKQKPAVTFAPERPSINSLDPKPTSDAKKKLTFASAADKSVGDESAKFKVDPPSVKPFSLKHDKVMESKANNNGPQNTLKAKPSVSFTIPEKTRPTNTSKEDSPTRDTLTNVDYKERLQKFYEVHNPAKLAHVDKTVADFKGKEKEMFSRLFDKYVPGSTEDTVKKFLDGGPVPPKPSAGPSVPAAPVNKVSFAFPKSPAGPTPSASPFGKSTFNLGASSSSNKNQSQPSAGLSFGGFGGQKPQSSGGGIDYRQKLVEFYQQHNPTKLGDVDSTLAKYKGNEAKLFQNLSIKYKTANPLGAVAQSPVLPPKSPGSSPFGNAGAFSSISLGGTQSAPSFGSTNQIGFGAKASGSASPAQSPFVTSPVEGNSFRSIGSGSFTTGTATPPAFGGGVSSSPAFGAASQLGGGSAGFGLTQSSAHRDRLVKFYQQYNPDKLKDVDSTLEKYKGNEEKLFKMLEQKYVTGVPTQPSAFGAPAAGGSPFGGGSAFGAPSPLGGTTGAPAFGSASALGGGAASAAPSFGASSRLGGTAATPSFGSFSAPSASSGAAATGSGFGSFSGQATFGGFGAQQGGSGFGANTSSGFGSANGGFGSGGGFGGQGFAGSSFTQMR
ncbi:hypothetical protein PINS_up004106 [Pythium insidiosum]|nr:hypothetical protein PINS_up004106 [Pythium insidiosum]